MESKLPLIIIAGPTASGKTELALKVAERFNGEIICADSRTVYKGMDIGTAKSTKSDQKKIRHHLLDIVEPGEVFTAFDFQKCARTAIKDIRSRKKVPIMTGGTGLYIDSIFFNYKFPVRKPASKKLLTLTVAELQEYCKKNKIILPLNRHNKRHLLSAIEQKDTKPSPDNKPLANSLIVGITTSKSDLDKRIAQRAQYIFTHGIIEEASTLGKKYGWDSEAMTANIYRIIYQLEKNELTLEEAMAKSLTLDKQLARRQLTWLKRNPFILWRTLDKAEQFLFDFLAKTEQK